MSSPPLSAKPSLLIANRKSGSGKSDLAAGLALLRERGLTLIEHYPDDVRRVPQIIRDHANEVDRIILGGGDGTFNAAAEALVEAGLPLGVLPLGTANDLARSLKIPVSLPEACGVIADGRLHTIDVGCVNDKLFFNVANIGLGVNVTRRLSRETKARWGWLSYTRGVFDAIRDNRSFGAHITCDGQNLQVRSIQIAVGNGRYYGGGMAVSEEAAIDDHMLDLYSLEPQSLLKLIALAPALRAGQVGDREGVHCLRGRDILIETHRSKSVCTDGEFTTRTPARFRVLPRALSIYVSEAYLKEQTHADE